MRLRSIFNKPRAILALVAAGTFLAAGPVRADDSIPGWVASFLASIAQVLIELVGKLLITLIEILTAIVQYNDFINAPAVDLAWVLVRDVANMAFLIIFIAIAFATILGVEKYEYKQHLPKLLMMAVLINFSRTICGIVLDAAQVLMMTFVNGFKDVAAGNLIRGFGVTDMLTLRDFSEEEAKNAGVTDSALAAASILAVIMLVIATLTVGIIVIMFLVRVIYLWVLIILSPLAFMLAAAPGFSGKFSEWWGKFVRYALFGPILAFFLWLSFSIMAAVPPGGNLAGSNAIFQPEDTIAGRTNATITAIGNSQNLLSFGIAIALLLMSLGVANEIGVRGGSLAGSALAKIQSGSIKLAKVGALIGATGGLGTGLAAAGLLGTKTGRQFTGRKLDDLLTPTLTKGIGKVGKALFDNKYVAKVPLIGKRLGVGAAALAESGVKIRTLKEGWKQRAEDKEKMRTAKYAGASRDLFNGVIDGDKSNYAFRNQMALVNEKAKKQMEETDGSTETLIDILENSKSEVDRMAAAWNLYNQNDPNEINLESKYSKEIHNKVLEEMGVGIEKETAALAALESQIPQAILDGWKALDTQETSAKDDLQNINDEYAGDRIVARLAAFEEEQRLADRSDDEIKQGKEELEKQILEEHKQKSSPMIERLKKVYQERESNVVAANQTEEGLGGKLKDLGARRVNLSSFEKLKAKFEKYDVMDTEVHREVGLRHIFGNSPAVAQFTSKLGQLALSKGGFNSFAMSSYDPATRNYNFARLTDPANYFKHVGAVGGKARNLSIPNILGGHPGNFRFEVKKDGVRGYDDNLSDIGRRLFTLTLPNLVERNLGQLRVDALAALIGGINIKNYPDMFSDDPIKQELAKQAYYEALLEGFKKTIQPIMGFTGQDPNNVVLLAVNRNKPGNKPKPS